MHIREITDMVLMLLFFAAAIWDILCSRVPNAVVIAGFICSLIIRYMKGQWSGLLMGVLGMAVILVCFWPLFIIRVIGAGDIKLLMVLMMCSEYEDFIRTLAVILVIAGIMSLIRLLTHKALTARLRYLGNYIKDLCCGRAVGVYDPGASEKKLTIPMALPIFIGAVLYIAGVLHP